MVVVVPAIVVSVVMMLDLMRRSVMLDDNRATVLFMHDAMVVLKVVFPAINIPHVAFIDVPSARVVEKIVSTPFAALKAGSGVAVSIADSTVVADVRTPIACVEAVVASFPSPIGWRPKHAGCRRPHPCPSGPEVTVRAVSPIAGSP
jgi:hypothetical protein